MLQPGIARDSSPPYKLLCGVRFPHNLYNVVLYACRNVNCLCYAKYFCKSITSIYQKDCWSQLEPMLFETRQTRRRASVNTETGWLMLCSLEFSNCDIKAIFTSDLSHHSTVSLVSKDQYNWLSVKIFADKWFNWSETPCVIVQILRLSMYIDVKI